MDDSHAVTAAFTAAHAALQQPEFQWIGRSALTERAYWLGLFQGLNALHRGDALSVQAFQRLRDAAGERDGDDAFRDSPFAEALGLMRDAIHDPRRPELEALETALESVVAHLDEVQGERARAADAVHAAVEGIRPYTAPHAFRVLDADEHARLQQLVRSLEDSLRVLALTEARWARRLGVDR